MKIERSIPPSSNESLTAHPPLYAEGSQVALRGYMEPLKPDKYKRKRRATGRYVLPEYALIFDTETSVDPTQKIHFGWAQYVNLKTREIRETILFYDENLSPQHIQTIKETFERMSPSLSKARLMALGEFQNLFLRAAYENRDIIAAFNMLFDVSRIAAWATRSRRALGDGFSFILSTYENPKTGRCEANRFRPRVKIEPITTKMAFMQISPGASPNAWDTKPEEGTGEAYRGHLIDLRQLTFGLTAESHTLESACRAFGIEYKKRDVRHGEITLEYLTYGWEDVEASRELLFALLEEHEKHPIDLSPWKVFSSASYGKAYMRAMGLRPTFEHLSNFPKDKMGAATSAFYGGRAEVRIRRSIVPCVPTDFTSMYPTVNVLMGLLRYETAQRIDVTDATEEIRVLLAKIAANPQMLYEKATWTNITSFARISPRGDVLPVRAKYEDGSQTWNIGFNHLWADEGLWYAVPDLLASILLTGKTPIVLEGFRLVPKGYARTLRDVAFRGTVTIAPKRDDLYRTLIEQRKGATRQGLPEREATRLDQALKIVANATSYGVKLECNPQDLKRNERSRPMRMHGINPSPWEARVTKPEAWGSFAFPPLGALVTSAARLMLALLQYEVERRGGTYVMCDTDSMAIIATETGGAVPCVGGAERLADGGSAVRALSWTEVDEIREHFDALNPYDPNAVRHVLKIEDENFVHRADENGKLKPTKERRQVYCFAIAAKRYAFLLIDEYGQPEILREGHTSGKRGFKEHGLGHLLNPTDPESENRDWIGEVWLWIIRRALGLSAAEPTWFAKPSMTRYAITTPEIWDACRAMRPNHGDRIRAYRESMKPGNFMLSPHVTRNGHPIGMTNAEKARFQLVGSYERDPRRWRSMRWTNRYAPEAGPYRITTGTGYAHDERTVVVQSYGDVISAYEYHPETKSAAPDGTLCGKRTIGMLRRRMIHVRSLTYVGKESNRLDEVMAGLVHDPDEVFVEIEDAMHGDWAKVFLPLLRHIKMPDLEQATGLSRRALQSIRASTNAAMPHAKNRVRLEKIVWEHACTILREANILRLNMGSKEVHDAQ